MSNNVIWFKSITLTQEYVCKITIKKKTSIWGEKAIGGCIRRVRGLKRIGEMMWFCFHLIKQTNKWTTELLESSEPRNPLITCFSLKFFLLTRCETQYCVVGCEPCTPCLPPPPCSYQLPPQCSLFSSLCCYTLYYSFSSSSSLCSSFPDFGVAFPNTRSIHALWDIPRVAIKLVSIRRSQLRASYVISSAKFE